MTEQKLKELLADMTLEEKVNQMSQVVGAFFNKDMDITAMGPMADKGFTPENVALSGSILGSMGAAWSRSPRCHHRLWRYRFEDCGARKADQPAD